MNLKEYEQKKFLLADIIRSAQAIDTKSTAVQGGCRELLARLAEDQFNLMVVGRFSRGKSTLMNAILGADYLPTGIVPLTSVITTVRYGSRAQAVLHFQDSGLNYEVPLPQLAEYVTQKGNPGNAKRIAWAEIQLPAEILRRGFFFVDTPGLGSPIIENTLTTERFMPEADAFILVTSYESPLSAEEVRILERIRNASRELFVVVNKQDTVTAEEREQARQFVAEQLAATLGYSAEQIYSISARQALEAKTAGNEEELKGSGIQAFESELLRFLTETRARSFLVSMYRRTLDRLMEWPSEADQREHRAAWDSIIRRMQDQREAITGVAAPAATQADVSRTGGPEWKLQIDRKTGCSVCGAVLEATFRFLSKYQYQLTIDPEIQGAHASRHGFCPLHTWQYEGISSPYGVCAAYPPLAHDIAARLSELAGEDRNTAAGIAVLVSGSESCPACEVRRQAERASVEETARAVRSAVEGDRSAPACCLMHLAAVVQSLDRDASARRQFIEAHASLLERTAEDLQRYALKHDALRRYLTSEEERRAAQTALLLLAGHRNLSSPWTFEYVL